MTDAEKRENQRVSVQSQEAISLQLDGELLSLADLETVFGRRLHIEIGAEILQRLERSRAAVEKIAAGSLPVYGVNTGFGHLCTKLISPDQVDRLQENLIISHAVAVGPSVCDDVVRLMMLLKIHGLAKGYSGVRTETVQLIASMLNVDFLPVIPSQGSLGASGDLAPLAHMVLPMIGRGQVRIHGREMDSAEAFAQAGLEPTRLGAKEGLALINGTQFMSAHAVGLIIRGMHLLKHADIVAAMSLEGLEGSLKPFAEKLHDLRPHRGAIETAANVRQVMEGSKILESHAECGRVQDPYSLRCVPQVHGAVRQAVHHAAEVVETEINSVTDNPVIFDENDTISGGHFHGQPLAMMLDYLAIALSELANISERRIYLLLHGHRGLPELLMKETGLNSGFMLPQYTAAALVNENKVHSTPASVDSIPTSLGQEDHVSMGATSANKAWRIIDNVETVIAIEQMCAAQALDFRAPVEPGRGVKIAHQLLREKIPHAEEDRLFGEDIRASLALLRSRRVVQSVEQETGRLQ